MFLSVQNPITRTQARTHARTRKLDGSRLSRALTTDRVAHCSLEYPGKKTRIYEEPKLGIMAPKSTRSKLVDLVVITLGLIMLIFMHIHKGVLRLL